jgi:hypothetical protein
MEKSKKLASIILYVLMAVSVVLFLIMFTSIDSETNPGERARNLMALNINWSIVMFFIAAIAAVGFAVVQLFSDKTKAINGIAVMLLMGVVVFVSYMLASNEIPQFFGVEKFVGDGTLTPSISRWIGAGLNTTYILAGSAILSVIGFGAASVFKR